MVEADQENALQVKNLSAGYGDVTILKDVTFEVPRGDIFVILGGSGCGKSTLLRHLIGLEKPMAGEVLVGGENIQDIPARAFQRILMKMGVLFQSSALIGSMTVGENVALPIREYTRLGHDQIQLVVKKKLSLVDLEGTEHLLPSELSGGMKKRAGLARAMALNPEMLFLDEPSAGLDPVTSAEIDQLILSINKSLNTTIVIVTHELASIFTVAKEVIMLDKSVKGIVAKGDPVDLRDHSDNEIVTRFFNRQAG